MELTYIDHMGNDLTVVNAARVSFNKESSAEEWTDIEFPHHLFEIPEVEDRDRKLIKYLARHKHWTPFGHAQLTLRFKAPIFVARQLAKHQVGMVWNEVSRRYVDSPPEFYWPEEWRGKPVDKKQGSSNELVDLEHDGLGMSLGSLNTTVAKLYSELIERGAAPEQARMILPQNTYTEWYWTGSLAAWARVYNLRVAPDTQQETRELIQQINYIAGKIWPASWDALTNEGEA